MEETKYLDINKNQCINNVKKELKIMLNTHLAIMKKEKIEFLESVNIPDGRKRRK